MERLINNDSQVLLGNDMREMNDAEKAYIACFLDTDGTITLRMKKIWFDPRLIFVNSEEIEILEELRKITGIKGSIGTQCRYKAKGKNKKEYRYEIDKHESVEPLLREIIPFIKLKRKRKIAKLLLEYFDIRNKITKKGKKRPNSKDFTERMFEIQKEIARLNKK